MESCFNRYRVSVWEDEKVLEMDGDDIVQQCECIQCHRTAHLKTGKVNFNVIYILPIRGGQNSFFFYPSRILGPWKVNS